LNLGANEYGRRRSFYTKRASACRRGSAGFGRDILSLLSFWGQHKLWFLVDGPGLFGDGALWSWNGENLNSRRRAGEYRRRAAKLTEDAQRVRDAADRWHLLDLAEGYVRAAFTSRKAGASPVQADPNQVQPERHEEFGYGCLTRFQSRTLMIVLFTASGSASIPVA
jgi:hypothetical protein